MYIDKFWCGVIATVIVEIVIIVVFGIRHGGK